MKDKSLPGLFDPLQWTATLPPAQTGERNDRALGVAADATSLAGDAMRLAKQLALENEGLRLALAISQWRKPKLKAGRKPSLDLATWMKRHVAAEASLRAQGREKAKVADIARYVQALEESQSGRRWNPTKRNAFVKTYQNTYAQAKKLPRN